MGTNSLPAAPVAKQVPHTFQLHGENIVDNYHWMRDLNDPDTLAYLKAENAYCDAYLADNAALRDKMYSEMRGRVNEVDVTVPTKKGRFEYYSRTEQGQEYSIICRKRVTAGSKEEILLDQNEMAKGFEHFSLGFTSVSPSGNFLVYSTDTKGYRQYSLFVKNLRTGVVTGPLAERTTSVAWCKDNRTLFYTTEDATTKRSNQLYRYKLGQKTHKLVFEEKDEFFRIGVGKSNTGAFIYLNVGSHTTSTVSFIKADKPLSKFKELAPRTASVMYDVDDDGKNFYVLTNDTGKDYRLVKVSPSRLDSKHWKELIPHRAGVLLSGVDLYKNHYVVFEKSEGLMKVRVVRLSDSETHFVKFADEIYEVGGIGSHDFDITELRLGYQSMVSPSSTLAYDLNTREFKTLKETEVKGYDRSQYKTARIYATAGDGTKVPMSIVYKGELKQDGKRPGHCYGYGSYGFGMPANFSQARLSLLDRGFVYAICHIRGGNELGEQWREDGKLKKKMNTFTDFVACVNHLVKEGYTSHDRVTMQGGSAGGLLMGAVLNIAPGAVKAAIANVPFVDVINTMLDESLPLTVGEFEEWGNPKVKVDYDYMRTYSPYENISAVDYPTILMKTAVYDSQVPYWEASKFTARMRALRTDKNPILLHTMIEAGGHGGPSGRFKALEDVAGEYAFLVQQVGDAAWQI